MKRTVIVLGMHRSGTSLLAELLAAGGLALPAQLLPPHHSDNPRGYFESREVVSINNEFLVGLGQSWKTFTPIPETAFSGELADRARLRIETFLQDHFRANDSLVLKDPRLCRLLPLWMRCLESREDVVVALQVIRRSEAVNRSLGRRLDQPDLTPAAITDIAHARLLWVRYNLDGARNSAALPRMTVSYEQLTTDPHSELVRIKEFITSHGLDVPSFPEGVVQPARTHEPRIAEWTDDSAAFLDALYQDLCEETRLERVLLLLDELSAPGRLDPALPEVTPDILAASVLKELSATVLHHPGRGVGRTGQARHHGPVVFVTSDATTRGHLYRVKNPVDALQRAGWRACWLTVDQLSSERDFIDHARAVIFFRCVWTKTLSDLYAAARAASVPIGFDIDDLLFDHDVLSAGWFAGLPGDQQELWRSRIAGYRKAMSEADFLIVPTESLARQARLLGKPVLELPNGFSPETANLSGALFNRPPGLHALRIGYASGTPTHDSDFATIATPLAELMSDRSDTLLTIVGPLNTAGMELPMDRVEHRPLVPHCHLPYELSRFDINLAPLERNPFCDAKSPLKYFEAGLAGVPTIAVRNPVFESCITSGANGFLASSPQQWAEALNSLGGDPALRERMGAEARVRSRNEFLTDSLVISLQNFLDETILPLTFRERRR